MFPWTPPTLCSRELSSQNLLGLDENVDIKRLERLPSILLRTGSITRVRGCSDASSRRHARVIQPQRNRTLRHGFGYTISIGVRSTNHRRPPTTPFEVSTQSNCAVLCCSVWFRRGSQLSHPFAHGGSQFRVAFGELRCMWHRALEALKL